MRPDEASTSSGSSSLCLSGSSPDPIEIVDGGKGATVINDRASTTELLCILHRTAGALPGEEHRGIDIHAGPVLTFDDRHQSRYIPHVLPLSVARRSVGRDVLQD